MVEVMDKRKIFRETEIGIIPEDWEVKKLGNYLLQRPDYGINAGAVAYDESLPVYLRITDITDDGKYSKKNIVSVNHPFSSSFYLGKGDLVFARTGASVGKTYLYNPKDGKLVFAGFLVRIKTNPDLLVPEYFEFYTQTSFYWKWIRTNSLRTGQPGINGSEYGELPIILPPKAEQIAIATALSDMDELINGIEKLLAKKRSIKQGAMQELLRPKEGWVVKKLGEIFKILRTANNSRAELTASGEIEYIHYGDIHTKWECFLDCSIHRLPFIPKEKVHGIPYLENGDLIIADASEDYDGLGACVEVKNASGRKIVAGLHTLLLRGDKSIIADGFKGYLRNFWGVRDALIKLSTGVSVFGISKTMLKKIEISIPSLIEEQTHIAQVLSDMDTEIETLEKKLQKYRLLKQGMMQTLLTGKIRLI